MIIRLTQKLVRKLKTTPEVCLPPDPHPLADWTAHIFTVQGVQYIILTNSATLYSVVMYGRGISDDGVFIQRMFEGISEYMTAEGGGDLFQQGILPHAGRVVFSKTGDRRVLGSINDHVICAKVYLDDQMECSPFEAARRLNRTPMSLLSYARPCDALREAGKTVGIITVTAQ